jgi:crotonobetainyl-CoA:carnitine CoA-transferase CaiB-like acyl-CoA transferase
MDKIFENYKIVELASVLAGPMVGTFFSELGADVIKIENKTVGGDITRNWFTKSENTKETSSYFASINYNKTSYFLDLHDEDDYNTCITFIRDCDIIISNFKYSSAIQMKLDYETLKKFNPKLIYAQLNSYPFNNEKPAFDVVLQAEAGFMYLNGDPDSNPTKIPIALIDVLAAHQLKEAILIAIIKLHKTGKGSLVSTSLFESAIASLVNQASNYLMNDKIPQRMGSLHPSICPYGEVIYSLDKEAFVLAIGNEKQFFALMKALEIDDENILETYSSNAKRVKNRLVLLELLLKQSLKFNSIELENRFNNRSVPFGKIKDMKSVFTHEAASNMILTDVDDRGKILKRVKTIAFDVTD